MSGMGGIFAGLHRARVAGTLRERVALAIHKTVCEQGEHGVQCIEGADWLAAADAALETLR